MINRNLAWDMEVGGCALQDALKFKPVFEASGTLKDPVKIAADIANKEQKWMDAFALSALTGRILVSGFKDIETGETVYIEGDEREIICQTLGTLADNSIYGHYVYTYDLPLLIRRAWHHNVPSHLLVPFSGERRDWERAGVHDTAHRWSFNLGGDEKYISLDHLAKHLGVGEKNGDGIDFAGLYAKDRKAAFVYFDNDLTLTAGCAKRMFYL